MQKNTLIAAAILIVVGIAGYFLLTKYEPQNAPPDNGRQIPPGDETISEDREVIGPVTAIDTEKAMVDGPYLVTIQTADNEMVTIAIPSMGIQLCEAKDSILAIDQVTVGETIEARGSVGPEGQIVPCSSKEHYFRIATEQKG